MSVLVLNGTSSSDDLAIVNYSWTRESDSLAVGNVIGTSDKEAVLMVRSCCANVDIQMLKFVSQLTGIVAGTYKYKLTVADEQGLTGTEIVAISVHEDPLIMNLVEVVLTAEASMLSQQEVSLSLRSSTCNQQLFI